MPSSDLKKMDIGQKDKCKRDADSDQSHQMQSVDAADEFCTAECVRG